MTPRAAGERRRAYREWAAAQRLPLFLQPWWLDATCGSRGWTAALGHKNGEVVAAIPLQLTRRARLSMLTTPPLTQHVGPWLAPGRGTRTTTRISHELDLLSLLIDDMPEADVISFRCSAERTNWLPFYWRGYQCTTRYSYVLPGITDPERLRDGLRSNVRGALSKAVASGISVRAGGNVADFLATQDLSFGRQGIPNPIPATTMTRIIEAARSRDAGETLFAEDAGGTIHAVCFIAWDDDTAYYLAAGADPQHRSSGAQTLLLWDAIKRRPDPNGTFDFEGSMIPSIEFFFRGFGGELVPSFQLRKHSRRARALFGLREAADILRGRPGRAP